MELYKALALLFSATEGHPLCLGNVAFWVDPVGPWAGELSFSIPAALWNPRAIGESVADLATLHSEVWRIVSRYAVAA
jgi:hypothetical protein